MMKPKSIKLLTGQILTIIYLLLVGFLVVLTMHNPAYLVTVLIVAAIVGVVLAFFYPWLVTFF